MGSIRYIQLVREGICFGKTTSCLPSMCVALKLAQTPIRKLKELPAFLCIFMLRYTKHPYIHGCSAASSVSAIPSAPTIPMPHSLVCHIKPCFYLKPVTDELVRKQRVLNSAFCKSATNCSSVLTTMRAAVFPKTYEYLRNLLIPRNREPESTHRLLMRRPSLD